MKKLIISLFILINSVFAFADDKREEFIDFVKKYNVMVGKVGDNSAYVPPIKDIPYMVSFYNDKELTIENFDNIVNNIGALSFDDSNITDIPSNLLSILPNLMVLSFKNMTLNSFPKINTLKQLYFSNINFHKIEKDVFENRSLVVLTIRSSNLEYLSKDIENLVNLRRLNVSNNQLQELPSEIGTLVALEELYVDENSFIKLQSEIANLINLNILGLSKTKIKKLPIDVENLSNLETLNLNDNDLEELPISVLKLKLKTLKVANNNLKTLPSNFGDITTLRYLDLRNNQLKYLPDSFINLKEFAYLFLDNNNLRELPKDFFTIFKNHFVTYEGAIWPGVQLYISNNKISFFDKSICEAKSIYIFNFYNNYVDTFPKCVNNVFSNIWIVSDIFGSYMTPYDVLTNISSWDNVNVEEFLKKLGWSVNKNVLTIDYIFKNYFFDSKTISLKPILGDDFNITSYSWNFGDGNTSTQETPTHRYKNYGDYNVTLNLNNGEYNTSKIVSIYPRVLELKKGWNMITSPTKDDINASLFDTVWSYQNDIWENNHSYLTPTIGYWVKLSNDLNYSYSGEVYELPNYKIKSGWNFVGSGESWFRENNETIYQYKNSEWLINSNEIKRGDGFWVKK